jgi:hypothetical protein
LTRADGVTIASGPVPPFPPAEFNTRDSNFAILQHAMLRICAKLCFAGPHRVQDARPGAFALCHI